ncbi:O-antigen ligase family protein [Undibacterium arcticum]|uniref:O-antigen ligase family protein n=1 Tax=Undibacterium arcticum TaxID=1762892 RepID=A0ABV7F4J2_9BURK
MHFLTQKSRLQLLARNDVKQSLALLVGAILIALLTWIIAELIGEIPALFSVLSLIFVVVVMCNYKYGVVLAVILLPLSSTPLIPRALFGVTGFNPLNVTLLLSAASLLLAWLINPRKFSIPKWPRHFWVYLAILALAALHGASQISSIPAYFKILQIIEFDSAGGYLRDTFLKPPVVIFATAFMFSIVVRNARLPHAYLIPLFCSGIVLPIVVIAYVASSGESLMALASSHARGFLSVMGMHANELGLMFNMVFALALFCFFSASNSLEKWMLGATTVIVMAAVALTFSRGAYLGLFSVVAYFLFTQRRFRAMLVVLLLVTLAALFMPDAVVERASMGLGNGNVEDVSAGRVDEIWRPLIPEILSNPLIGHGLGSILWSESAQHRAILPVGHPHSAYLGVLLDFGVLGAIVIFVFFRHMWRLFIDLAKRMPDPIWRAYFRGAAACILLLLVQGVTDDSFTPTRTQPFLWLSYGIATGFLVGTKTAKSDQAKQRMAHYFL